MNETTKDREEIWKKKVLKQSFESLANDVTKLIDMALAECNSLTEHNSKELYKILRIASVISCIITIKARDYK